MHEGGLPVTGGRLKRAELKRDREKLRAFLERGRESSARSLSQPKPSRPRRKAISECSVAQRRKVKEHGSCIVCGRDQVDPAHLTPRTQGGCQDALCVVPLCRAHHVAFDTDALDLQPYVVGFWVPELQHALGHYKGDSIALLHRLTGERYVPTREAA